MRLFFVVILGLGALGLVSCYLDGGPVQSYQVGEQQSSGFLGTLLDFPNKIGVGIFKAIGAVFRLIFVRAPEDILDVIKRMFYRVAHVFGKKDPYDVPSALGYSPPGYNQQTVFTNKGYGYPTGYNYGSGLYRNSFGRKK